MNCVAYAMGMIVCSSISAEFDGLQQRSQGSMYCMPYVSFVLGLHSIACINSIPVWGFIYLDCTAKEAISTVAYISGGGKYVGIVDRKFRTWRGFFCATNYVFVALSVKCACSLNTILWNDHLKNINCTSEVVMLAQFCQTVFCQTRTLLKSFSRTTKH